MGVRATNITAYAGTYLVYNLEERDALVVSAPSKRINSHASLVNICTAVEVVMHAMRGRAASTMVEVFSPGYRMKESLRISQNKTRP